MVAETAAAHPDRLAATDRNGELTFAELDQRVDAAASTMIDAGLRTSDPVVLVVGNDGKLYLNSDKAVIVNGVDVKQRILDLEDTQQDIVGQLRDMHSGGNTTDLSFVKGVNLAERGLTNFTLRFSHVIRGDINLQYNRLCLVDFGALTKVDGSIHLQRNDLKQLRFQQLTFVAGGINLAQNTELTAVDMGSLQTLRGDLDAWECVLSSFSFGQLTSVGGFLRLYDNQLTSFSFGNVTTLGGGFNAHQNKLASVSFGALTHIGSAIHLHANRLTAISLAPLTHVGGSIYLHNNNRLTAVDFARLARVQGDLTLNGNALTGTRGSSMSIVPGPRAPRRIRA